MNVGDGKKIRFYASIGMYWHESKCVFNFFYFVHICPCVCVHGSSFVCTIVLLARGRVS